MWHDVLILDHSNQSKSMADLVDVARVKPDRVADFRARVAERQELVGDLRAATGRGLFAQRCAYMDMNS